MVGRDVVAVVIDRGPPSLLGVDVIRTRHQARLMNLFRETHILAVYIVEDDVRLRWDTKRPADGLWTALGGLISPLDRIRSVGGVVLGV